MQLADHIITVYLHNDTGPSSTVIPGTIVANYPNTSETSKHMSSIMNYELPGMDDVVCI